MNISINESNGTWTVTVGDSSKEFKINHRCQAYTSALSHDDRVVALYALDDTLGLTADILSFADGDYQVKIFHTFFNSDVTGGILSRVLMIAITKETGDGYVLDGWNNQLSIRSDDQGPVNFFMDRKGFNSLIEDLNQASEPVA